MRKILILGLVLSSMISCSLDDDQGPDFGYELAPVESVTIPDTLHLGEAYDFEISYQRFSTCHSFYGYEYTKSDNERIIAVVNTVHFSDNCEDLENEIVTNELNFLVERDDYYIFKFWQGEDDNGEPIYLTKEVPVATE